MIVLTFFILIMNHHQTLPMLQKKNSVILEKSLKKNFNPETFLKQILNPEKSLKKIPELLKNPRKKSLIPEKSSQQIPFSFLVWKTQVRKDHSSFFYSENASFLPQVGKISQS